MSITHQDIPTSEIEFTAIRASGPGGQNVNKVSTAIHLRFDIKASSLPDELKHRLLKLRDRRITPDGIVVIKAQTTRSQDKNREDALTRLDDLLAKAQVVRKARKKTKPSKSAVKKRLDNKNKRGETKRLRRSPTHS